jgi:hypothetical protein
MDCRTPLEPCASREDEIDRAVAHRRKSDVDVAFCASPIRSSHVGTMTPRMRMVN